MNNSLFTDTTGHIPLAERLRPHIIEGVIGQSHLLSPGKPLQLAFAAKKPHSMILWGPPGVGKTTLARLMADAFSCSLIQLSTVFAGVKEIRAALEQAEQHYQQNKQTILFVDEVHRFNKAQQDAFLPVIEAGIIIFIGATTENPSFELNTALLSRTQVYVLMSLNDADMHLLIKRAEAVLAPLTIAGSAYPLLINAADGDARKLLNLLEQASAAAQNQPNLHIDDTFIKQILVQTRRRFDKEGEQFYDQISALHKSIRGSDPDAALYWLHRMLDGGSDPRYLIRRLLRTAYEDIGLADPRAVQMVLMAAETYERLGSPEGDLALSQATIYLAIAPKSNAVYQAHKQATRFVQHDQTRAVPVHLRNAPTELMQHLGYGNNYRYAHDEPEAYAAGENYLPDDVSPLNWYQPTDRGLENKIAEKLRYLRQLDKAYKKSEK